MDEQVQEGKRGKIEWTHQDGAECSRLVNEMTEDVRIQFQLFTFAISATTIVLSVLASYANNLHSTIEPGLFFLAPLFVLIPTSLIVINRARARNRKVAFMMVTLDYKRLLIDGVTDETPLEKVRRRYDLPWETALHLLDRTNKEENRRPHIAKVLLYMMISYWVIEILCILLAGSLLLSTANQQLLLRYVVLPVAVVDAVMIQFRFRVLQQLKDKTSIQGYVADWIRLRYRGTMIPCYLHQWIDECHALTDSKTYKV